MVVSLMQLYKEHREGIYQTCKSLVHDQPFSSVIISILLLHSLLPIRENMHSDATNKPCMCTGASHGVWPR